MTKEDDAQILLIAGLIMIIAYLSLASISIRISDVNYGAGDEFIATYKDVREKFGITLNQEFDNVRYSYPDQNESFSVAFASTDSVFKTIEALHGLTFDANLIEVGYDADYNISMARVSIYLKDLNLEMSENVYYSIN